ncbi:MAG: amino acid permease [Ignavibacteriae bacterium HGW-Ignavibacteriae-3]|nr:MAG: amino acid permease [Ignavibacteriae bacterium HGW-Ignavibacteriae-3]
MFEAKKIKPLKKGLKLFQVYAITTGTTISAGFFLLPGLAASQAGPAIVLAYVIAVIPLIPAIFSILELATAMPKAGGVYYFLDRTLGPLMGTIGGFGTWFVLILKVAFALIGMSAYITLFFPNFQFTPIAIVIAMVIGIIDYFGAKKSGGFQSVLVTILLIILLGFLGEGLVFVKPEHFTGFFDSGFSQIISTAGMIYISYAGLSKITSLSEEIHNPERNLPLGVFLALGTALVLYILGTLVMVGTIPMSSLAGDLTPAATAARFFSGKIGVAVISIAALVAFMSVANAGTMSATRYPLAMSRDQIMPAIFKKLSKRGTPVYSIILTVSITILVLLLLNPTKIAKLASAFQLLMFALICLAVIIMRESRIESYDPGYRSPLYPWMQIFGIISSIWLIFQIGWLSIVFSLILVVLSVVWYWVYVRGKVVRTGAIYHIFERLGRQRHPGLDSELRGILKDKGLRLNDPFEEIVTRSLVIDLKNNSEFEEVVVTVAHWLATMVPYNASEIKEQFLEGTRIGATPVTHGIALPHLRIDGLTRAEMVLVRCNEGVNITFNNPLSHHDAEEKAVVKAIFFLISPEQNPTLHLRILAQIAGRVEEDNFAQEWNNAQGDQELKEVLLNDERFVSFQLQSNNKTGMMAGKALKNIDFPQGCLVAILCRNGESIVPDGKTVLQDGDRLTVIGDPKGMSKFKKLFIEES